MSKVLDVESASSTDQEYSFEDFQREQAEATKSGKSVELEGEKPKTSEVAPASERVQPQAETEKSETAKPKQVLSDEEKSRQKHANDGKRNREYLKEISDLRAENERLRSETSVKRTSETATAKTSELREGEPDETDPKYQGEKGWRRFSSDLARFEASETLKAHLAQQETVKRTQTVNEARTSLREKLNAYQEANADKVDEFNEALDIVREELEADFPEISGEIASHEKSPELIHYLGTNLDVFGRITSARGKTLAMKQFKSIVSEWEKPGSEATTTKPLPKPPVNLNGKGRTPAGSEILDKAAEDNDFTAAQAVFANERKSKKYSKWD